MRYVIDNVPVEKWYSGGAIALNALYRDLRTLGEDVYLANDVETFDLATEYNFFDFSTYDPEDCVVIYPEVEAENPRNFKNVVRWLLNYPGHFGIPTDKWDRENELYFTFIPYYTLHSVMRGYKISGELTCLYNDFNTFKNLKQERSGNVLTIRKGTRKMMPDWTPTEFTEMIVGRGTEKHQIAETFNKYETFYCVDHNSYLSVIAALCGCTTIVVPDPMIEEAEDWYQLYPLAKYGVAYGIEELDHAKETMHLVKDHLISLEKQGLDSVRKFTETAKENFS